MKKRMEIFLVAALLVAAAVITPKSALYVMNTRARTEKTCVCIDAGHGGADPGKVGVDGTLEKDINLQIAKRLKKLLEEEGIQVVMTRERDSDLAEEGSSNRKMSDLRKRCEIAQEADPDLVVSIHQNSFTDRSSKGAQTFYYGASEEGEILAATLQKSLIEKADPDNHREAKANGDYYLLRKMPAVTVIVECGFLSNPGEEQKLLQEDYQQKMAEAICDGILHYLKNRDI